MKEGNRNCRLRRGRRWTGNKKWKKKAFVKKERERWGKKEEKVKKGEREKTVKKKCPKDKEKITKKLEKNRAQSKCLEYIH